MKNIKSTFFIRKAYSYIEEKRKIILNKYNKAIQKRLDANIVNYISFSGRYIIYKSKYEGKEYDFSDILLYDGEFLNCKRLGKGKEYDCEGKLIYDGEYLNGKRNGKGIEYKDNKIIFDGTYLNGEKWNGKFIRYYSNRAKIFEVEYLNGKSRMKRK